jgi:hypothetical protein
MEYPQAFRSYQRKARRKHRCCECLGWIRKGEIYTYCSGIWDNHPASYKTCPDCTLLRFQVELSLGRHDYEDGICIGGLLEWICEARSTEFADGMGQIMRARGSKWKLCDSTRKLFKL